MEEYFVIAADGQKYGPANLAALNQWAGEGRVTPNTELERADTGQRLMAASLPGLSFPGAGSQAQPPISGPGPMEPTANPYGGMGTPGPNPYAQPPSPYVRPTSYGGDMGNNDLTVSWVMAVLGFFCCGLIFPIIGIVYANKAKEKGNPGGQAAWVVNLIVLILAGLGSLFYVGLIIAGMGMGANK